MTIEQRLEEAGFVKSPLKSAWIRGETELSENFLAQFSDESITTILEIAERREKKRE